MPYNLSIIYNIIIYIYPNGRSREKDLPVPAREALIKSNETLFLFSPQKNHISFSLSIPFIPSISVLISSFVFPCVVVFKNMEAAMGLMRRMPPKHSETALSALLTLLPHHSSDLLSQVDQPLQVMLFLLFPFLLFSNFFLSAFCFCSFSHFWLFIRVLGF